MTGPYEYGLWGLVTFHLALVGVFGVSFLAPQTRREWRSFAYARLARREEAQLEARFGEAYRRYRDRVPAFLPRVATDRLAAPSRSDRNA